MSKKLYLNQIKEGERVEGVFLVKYKALQVGKTGKPYLNIVLMDRSGESEGRVWDGAEEIAAGFEKDDFVEVRARSQAYNGRIQLNVFEVSRCDEATVDLADFLPATAKDIDAMYAELRTMVMAMGDKYLRALLLGFIDDPDLAWRIKAAPAARSMHHPFIGGLLEHTLSAMKLMRLVGAHYRAEGYGEVNPDLLLTGIFLHDIGKTLELNYRRSIDYSDAGKLVGHLVMGVEMVNARAARIPGFPEELRLLVNHMIVSHHGELAYGSPKRPKTLEAFIVHQVDDLDAKVNSFSLHMRKEADQEGPWTTFHKMWDRFLYKRPYNSVDDEDDAARHASELVPK